MHLVASKTLVKIYLVKSVAACKWDYETLKMYANLNRYFISKYQSRLDYVLEVFRNEILLAWQKKLNVKVILLNSEIQK